MSSEAGWDEIAERVLEMYENPVMYWCVRARHQINKAEMFARHGHDSELVATTIGEAIDALNNAKNGQGVLP